MTDNGQRPITIDHPEHFVLRWAKNLIEKTHKTKLRKPQTQTDYQTKQIQGSILAKTSFKMLETYTAKHSWLIQKPDYFLK